MALLLAVFQKMRMVREKNQLMLDQTRIESKLKRIADNITRTQKRYTSIIEQIRQQATAMQNNASMMFRGMCFGGGMSGGNIFDAASWLTSSNTNLISRMRGAYSGDNFDKLWAAHQNGSLNTNGVQGSYTAEDATQFYKVLSDAQTVNNMISQQQNWQYQYAVQDYKNEVSIWQQAQVEAIEAKQDEAVGQLTYEQTMLEIDKTRNDERLQMIEQQQQTYNQLASNEIKNSAPTFGLG